MTKELPITPLEEVMMTLTLHLPDELQAQAEALARSRGETVEALALELLTQSLAIYAGALPTQRERQTHNQARIRQLAATRGLNWDQLDHEAREQLIDTLLHE